MKFDVICGNPPYQVSDGGGVGSSALPVYNDFVDMAKSLNPRYLTMIIPSRWFTGGRGLDAFRSEMLKDKRMSVLHDFIEARDCFPGVEIKGGVCYFLWDKSNNSDCNIITHYKGEHEDMVRPLLEKDMQTFIRFHKASSILKQVKKRCEVPFSERISSNDPFGFDVREKGSYKRVKPNFSTKKSEDNISFYYNGWRNKGLGYLPRAGVSKNHNQIDALKVLIPKAWGVGDSRKDCLKPFIPEKASCCTETYLVISNFNSENELKNAISYIHTKFFHFMVSLIKNTQNTMKKAYSLVPDQDFLEEWNDKKLYKKYSLSEEEIEFIETMVPNSVLGDS